MKRLAWIALAGMFALPASAIENGTPVEDASYIQVGTFWRDDVPCTGTLVGPKVFVTAAHCAVALGTQTQGSFEVGNAHLSQHERPQVKRDNVYISPDYNFSGSGSNDLAVAILSKSVRTVKPLKLETTQVPVGETVTLAGFGDRNEDYRLRAGTSIVGQYFEDFMEIGPQAGGAVSQPGDSGGAVLVEREGHLRIAGVILGNSNGATGTTAFSNPKSIAFIKKLIADHGIQVCGLNYECE